MQTISLKEDVKEDENKPTEPLIPKDEKANKNTDKPAPKKVKLGENLTKMKAYESVTTIASQDMIKFDSLTTVHTWAFGMGHFFNDLTATVLMCYLVIYLTDIRPIDPHNASSHAGIVFMIGQIVDGLTTPTVGLFSDKFKTRFGKRKPWYVAGTCFVFVSFLVFFQGCLFCDWFSDSPGVALAYYALFFSTYNIGFASVQVPHMSLVPSLTCSRLKRDQLNSLRNTFTFAANLFAPGVAILIFKTVDKPIDQFKILSYVLLVIGGICNLFFIFSINEKQLSRDCLRNSVAIKSMIESRKSELDRSQVSPGILDTKEGMKITKSVEDYTKINPENLENKENIENKERDEEALAKEDEEALLVRKLSQYSKKSAHRNSVTENQVLEEQYEIVHEKIRTSSIVSESSIAEQVDSWTTWFKIPAFYQYCFAYMFCRITYIFFGTMIINYLTYVMQFSEGESVGTKTPIQLAILPLILYFFSLVGSVTLEWYYIRFGRKKTYVFGAIAIVISSVAMILITKDYNYLMYIVVCIMGWGQSLCMNTGIALISEVVGLKGSSGAFVFGFYGFIERCVNGVIVYVVLNSSIMKGEHKSEYIRWTVSLIPSIACLAAMVLILLGEAKDYQLKDDDKENAAFNDFVG